MSQGELAPEIPPHLDRSRYVERAEYDEVTQMVAAMHAAATGQRGGAPEAGVVEDVAALRQRCLAAEDALVKQITTNRRLCRQRDALAGLRGELRAQRDAAIGLGHDLVDLARRAGGGQPAAPAALDAIEKQLADLAINPVEGPIGE